MNAKVINVLVLYVAVLAFFISAAAKGCNECFVCKTGEDSCLDSEEDMSLALAVINGTESRLYAAYLMLLCYLMVVVLAPALVHTYGNVCGFLHLWLAVRVLVTFGCFFALINPPGLSSADEIRTNDAYDYKWTASQRAANVLFYITIMIWVVVATFQSVVAVIHKACGDGSDQHWGRKDAIVESLICFLRIALLAGTLACLAISAAQSSKSERSFGSTVAAHCLILVFIATTVVELQKFIHDEQQKAHEDGKAEEVEAKVGESPETQSIAMGDVSEVDGPGLSPKSQIPKGSEGESVDGVTLGV